ncbi:histidine kinase/PAS domain-containing protein [Methanobacterium formicicum]|uniref:Histidine kinase/PAS domain-containing protein n=1 Tax=Methanobacterium formicicum TaxID=2162 RepID=A0A089ZEH4_METFO|nr:PAS domain S-box protein [Methanobacterium formicicum]AIS31260.1 histidine kinase/PAS domain-containing protein [Methanobacterium formicicum]
MNGKEIISFKNATILAFAILISFTVVSLLLQGDSYLRMVFSDITGPVIEILVITGLFYAAYASKNQGQHVQIAWILMGVAFSFTALGDITWAILELVFSTNPFPSVADIFYLAFYPLFALGIYFMPRDKFSSSDRYKIILEMGIILLTVGLLLWVFLISPNLTSQEEFLTIFISVIYIVFDFVLLFALIRLLYSKFKEEYYGPLILIGLGMVALIITDYIYYLQTLQGTYVSGGLLDSGWILSYMLVGLAALLQITGEKYQLIPPYLSFIKKSSFTSYLPLLLALISFMLLVWANEIQEEPNIPVIELVVGIIILMVLFRQFLTERALSSSEKNYRDLVDNSLVGIYKTNISGDILFANESLAQIFKFSDVEELKSHQITEFYKNISARKEIIDKLRKEGSFAQYEVEMVSREGDTVNMLLSASLTGKVISGMLMDITLRKKAEKALQDSEEKYHTLFESNPTYTILVSLEGSILDVNSAASEFAGISSQELIGKNFPELQIFPNEEDIKFQRSKFLQALQGETIKPFQYQLIDYKGNYSWVESQLVPIKKDGEINSILVISKDITERKKAMDGLERMVDEKNILIKEIHHRVKNNMQIISSLLNLQSQHLKADEQFAVSILKESQNRVKSMAMIHENLYQSKDFTHIKFEDYITRLVYELFYSYSGDADKIRLVVDVDDVNLNMETAVPCGLIVSELFTNSVKYAFPEGREGEIRVSLKQEPGKDDDREFILTVSDDGVGFPPDLDYRNTETLGLELVNSLTCQIDGNISLDLTQGTKFTVKFKELRYKKRI